MTNESGGVHSRQWYYPYGEVWRGSGPLPTDRTFTGQRDVELGVMHYGARYYDPWLGRFVQADTVIEGGESPRPPRVSLSGEFQRRQCLSDPEPRPRGTGATGAAKMTVT